MVDVERSLTDLADHLDHPRGGDLADAVVARIAGEQLTAPRPRWLVPAVAAAVVVALSAAVFVLPQPRDALARWFGVGGVRLTLTDDTLPPGLGSDLDLGEPVAADEAADAVDFELAIPGDIGPPAAAFAGRPPGGISFVWAPSAGLPEVADTGVGLLLTEFPGRTDVALIGKEIGPGTQVEEVTVDGRDGFWITGAPHLVTYLDADGDPQVDSTRLAGNTLLWDVDGVTYRMEAALDLDRMTERAVSVRSLH